MNFGRGHHRQVRRNPWHDGSDAGLVGENEQEGKGRGA